MTYTIYVCPECGSIESPKGRYAGYCVTDHAHAVKREPVEVVPRAVADAVVGAAERGQRASEISGHVRYDFLDEALTKYREATAG